MKTFTWALLLTLIALPCRAETLKIDTAADSLREDRKTIQADFAKTGELMGVLKKGNLASATDLMNAIDNVLERTGSERYLLAIYSQVTIPDNRADAESLIREHYAALSKLTSIDAKAAHLVAKNCKSKDLAALATKVASDMQRIAARYQVFSEED